MNDRAITGVLMLSAAAALAWAWLNGHLDATIAKITSRATGTTPTGATPAAKQGGFGRAGRES